MSFFDDKIKRNYQVKKKKLANNLEEFQKQREAIPEDAVETLIETVTKHYKKQMKLLLEEREYYIEDPEAKVKVAVIYYVTEENERKDKQDNITNIPKIVKGGNLYFTASFPMFTDDEDAYFKIVTIFANPEDFNYDPDKHAGKMLKKNLGVLARGRMTEKYKPVDTEYDGYAMNAKDYKIYYNSEASEEVDKFSEIDDAEYRIYHTFNQAQILEMKLLK